MSAKKQPRNGKLASTPVVPPLKNEFTGPSPELQKILAKVYNTYQKQDDPKVNAACRHDFVFHMTDWFGDLQRLFLLYDHPDRATRKEAEAVVYGFLIHALPHLMAASHLLEGKAPAHPFEFPTDNLNTAE